MNVAIRSLNGCRQKTKGERRQCGSLYTSEGTILAVIADGMGGHRAGDYASSTAIKVIGEKFMKLDSNNFEDEDNTGRNGFKKRSIM